jgi:hypothetical protein
MMRAGVDPGLLDEINWWRSHDLWVWALDALAVYARVEPDRTAVPSSLCEHFLNP